MDHHSKKVLITGIDSFTGRYISDVFDTNGVEVFGTSIKISNSNNIKKLDLLDESAVYELINKLKPDYIIHLAGISFVGHTPIIDFYKVNVIGTENILKAVINSDYSPLKIVLASSATVYGNQSSNILDESMVPSPINHYGISKYSMELVARTYFDKLPIIITRPFNYSGVGQDDNFIIPKIVKHFKDKSPTILLGNTHTYREYNDVRWVSKLYLNLAFSSTKSEIVNLCSGVTHSIADILNICQELSDHRINIEVNQQFVRANEILELKGNNQKLKSIVDIKYQNNIKDLIATMLI